MKKNIVARLINVSAALSLSGVVSGQIMNPAPYCELNLRRLHAGSYFPGAPDTTGDGILNVTLETLNKSSKANVPDDSLYVFYNALPAPDLVTGRDYAISLKLGASLNVEVFYYSVWIDFNRNDIFDADELIMNNGNSGGEVPYGLVVNRSRQFSVPATAATGITRMRVARTGKHNVTEAYTYDASYIHPSCYRFSDRIPFASPFGEVEDYNVRITNSNSVGISTMDQTEKVKIYPNPAKDHLFLDIEQLRSSASGMSFTVFLTNLNGQVVKRAILKDAVSKINVADLPPGIYQLQISNEQQERMATVMVAVNVEG